MLSVLKLVSCQPWASRVLALRPPRPEKVTFHLSFGLIWSLKTDLKKYKVQTLKVLLDQSNIISQLLLHKLSHSS